MIIWLEWIDDCLITVDEKQVKSAKEKFNERFDCDVKYIGCKIEHTDASIKFAHSILIQSNEDAFKAR